MNEKSESRTRQEAADRIIAKIEPDIFRSYHELREDYLASIAVSLKRIADILTADPPAPPPVAPKEDPPI